MNQINKTFLSVLGIKPFNKLGNLCGNTPVTLAAVTAAAKVATQRNKSGGCNIYSVGAQGDCLNNISAVPDASADYNRNLVSDALVSESLVNACQRQLNGDTHVVAYSLGGCARFPPL